MNSLRRLVHSCTALNRNNNVQWRPMSYDAVKELIENLDPRKSMYKIEGECLKGAWLC